MIYLLNRDMVGTDDCWIEAFKIDATGTASTIALFLSTQLWILSGPGDFDIETEDHAWQKCMPKR
jgi:hypothetical protein